MVLSLAVSLSRLVSGAKAVLGRASGGGPDRLTGWDRDPHVRKGAGNGRLDRAWQRPGGRGGARGGERQCREGNSQRPQGKELAKHAPGSFRFERRPAGRGLADHRRDRGYVGVAPRGHAGVSSPVNRLDEVRHPGKAGRDVLGSEGASQEPVHGHIVQLGSHHAPFKSIWRALALHLEGRGVPELARQPSKSSVLDDADRPWALGDHPGSLLDGQSSHDAQDKHLRLIRRQ